MENPCARGSKKVKRCRCIGGSQEDLEIQIRELQDAAALFCRFRLIRSYQQFLPTGVYESGAGTPRLQEAFIWGVSLGGPDGFLKHSFDPGCTLGLNCTVLDQVFLFRGVPLP